MQSIKKVAASKKRCAGFTCLLIILLTGCVSSLPPYRPFANGSGYQEHQIEKNRYAVSFVGNSSMTAESTENYLIYRAAELTSTTGYDYFVMHDKNTKQKSRYRYYPYSNGRFGYYNSWGYGHYHYDYYDYCCPYAWYEVGAEILMYEGDKPKDNLNAYGSQEVLEYLGPNIHGVRNTAPTNQ